MEGHTLAECAKIAGSRATAEGDLARIGYRWNRSPLVQKCLGDIESDLDRGWRAWVKHAADVCDGLVLGATEIDILGNGTAIGRAMGKFVQRIEVKTTTAVEIRGFPTLPPLDMTPLDLVPLEVLEAAVARRRSLLPTGGLPALAIPPVDAVPIVAMPNK